MVTKPRPRLDPSRLAEGVIAVLAETLELDPAKIGLESSLIGDLGLDSFGAVELMFELENRSGLEIPDQDVQGFKRVADIVDYLEQKLGAGAPGPQATGDGSGG